LQSDVSHGVCVADNVAAAGEEQVEVFGQLPSATNVKRYVGTLAAFIGDCRITLSAAF